MSRSLSARRIVSSLAGLVAPAIWGLGQAQSAAPAAVATVEEVVVTAQRRVENVQEVPIAITALSGDALVEHHVESIMDLSALAPGLDIRRSDNSAIPKIFMRGVGLNDFNPTTASAVGIYEDGVYIASPLAQMGQFFDLERVEVLRGPQGTLYGRNTTGGAINLITRPPSQEWESNANVMAGNFSSLDFEGGLGGPIVKDALAFRVAVKYQGDSGYVHNRLTGQRGDDASNWTSRFSLRYAPGGNFTADLMVHYGENHGASIWGHSRQLFPSTLAATDPATGFCAAGHFYTGECSDIIGLVAGVPPGYSNPSSDLYSGDYLFKGRDIVKSFGSAATLRWSFDTLSLVSTTGFFHTDRNDREETDYQPDDLLNALYLQKNQAYSEELRLQSDAQGPMKWVTGLYGGHDYLSNNSWYDVLRPFRNPAATNPTGCDLVNGICVFNWPNTQTTDSFAGFGQLDYKLTNQLTGTFGLRYSTDHKSFHYTSCAEYCTIPIFQYDAAKSFSSVTGRLGAEYAATDTVNLYATYNRGAKSGGFFGGQTTDVRDLAPFADEKLNAYEIGAKTEWFGRRLRANVSGFYYDYRDLQVYTFVVRNNLTVQTLKNASNARIYGGDFELAATPIERLNVALAMEVLNAKYRDFVSAQGTYSGNTLPAAPDVSLSASGRYELPVEVFNGHFSAYMDVRYRTKIFFETRNIDRLSDPARTWVNAELGWKSRGGNLEIGFWGRNIFNETTIIEIDPIEGLGEDQVTVGKPRTYGIYVRTRT